MQQPQEEILNIMYHRVRLMIKSLNLSKTIKEATGKCGISKKCFYNYMRDYNIEKRGNVWTSNQLIHFKNIK
jgi:hypothetical protein